MNTDSGRIVVTGGGGMVGTALRALLPDARYLTRSDADLEDITAVRRLFQNIRPHVVVHLAALVGGITDNVTRPYDYAYRNSQINTNTIQCALETPADYFLAVSSTCAYPGVVAKYPMTEDQIHMGPPASENLPYAYSKRMMAVLLDAAAGQHSFKSAVLYPCNLYGPHDSFGSNRSHLVAALIRKVHEARAAGQPELQMLGTGKPLRQFMYVDDLAWVIAKFANQRIPGHFNVATPENLSVDAIAATVQEVLEYVVPRRYTGQLDGQIRKDASSRALKEILPDMTFTPLPEGVRRTYGWYLSQLAS